MPELSPILGLCLSYLLFLSYAHLFLNKIEKWIFQSCISSKVRLICFKLLYFKIIHQRLLSEGSYSVRLLLSDYVSILDLK